MVARLRVHPTSAGAARPRLAGLGNPDASISDPDKTTGNPSTSEEQTVISGSLKGLQAAGCSTCTSYDTTETAELCFLTMGNTSFITKKASKEITTRFITAVGTRTNKAAAAAIWRRG